MRACYYKLVRFHLDYTQKNITTQVVVTHFDKCYVVTNSLKQSLSTNQNSLNFCRTKNNCTSCDKVMII